ncbi:MAG: sigma-70 family RNA polymerase sigma factor [Planctomycetota bacterium]|nr:sigma-70 family RNA polymerase sigma factor [Planctomycetota bacterium]
MTIIDNHHSELHQPTFSPTAQEVQRAGRKGAGQGKRASPDFDAGALEKIRAGDKKEWEKLVRENAGRMLSVARRIVGTDADAEDAVQDAFMSAYRSLSRFDGRSQVSTWLHRITVNASLMKLRRSRRHGELPLDEAASTPRAGAPLSRHGSASRHATSPSSPADAMHAQHIRERFARELNLLPEAYRVVLVLRDIVKLNTLETSQALGVECGVVKTRLHRARCALLSRVAPLLADATDQDPGSAWG